MTKLYLFNQKFLYTVLFSVIFIISIGKITTFAEPVKVGHVVDPNNNPVSFVTIHNISSDLWLITDEIGEFIIPHNFIQGDSIEFIRIGYQKINGVLPSNKKSFIVTLPFAPVNLDSVEISKNSRHDYRSTTFVSKITILPQMGLVESRQAFSAIPGIYIKSYGGPAGISTLSLDGAPSSHTNISFAGFDLTSAQNGQLDISQIPPTLVNNIFYNPTLNEKNPEISNAEGSIEICPEWSRTGFLISAGSYGHRSFSGSINHQFKRFKGHITLGKRHEEGNYKARNPISNLTFQRKNNDFDQEYFASTFTTISSKKTFFNVMIMQSYQRRGIAGLIWAPTLDSRRSDRLSMIGSKFGWVNRIGYGYFQFLFRKSMEHYSNPQKNLNVKHSLFTYHVLLKQYGQFTNNLDVLFYLDSKYDLINSTSTKTHDRIQYKTMVSSSYFPYTRLSFHPTVSFNYSKDQFSNFDYDIKIRFYSKKQNNSVFFSAGKFYRYPTFNDLYWEPGGNPDLKPENTSNYICGTNFNIFDEITINNYLYYKESKNLILWTPLQSYWQPKNIRQAIRKGFKVILIWESKKYPFSANYNFSLNISEDRTHGDYYKKPLRYAPKYSQTLSLNWQPSAFLFHIQISRISERIAMYNWPDDMTLKPYTDISFSSSYTRNYNFGTIVFTTGINNFTGISYETLLGYPEPGRSFRLTITYEYN